MNNNATFPAPAVDPTSAGTAVELSGKKNSERLENLGPAPTHATYIEPAAKSSLSADHQEYLLRRHHTLTLDPLPGPGDADPFNWPTWQVLTTIPPACDGKSIR